MIVRNGAGLRMALRVLLFENWLPILLIVTFDILVGEIYRSSPGFRSTAFSVSSVSMLATVVGIFLVFRFDNAYQRWWEGRILWGQLVNVSRSFGRQVTTLLNARVLQDQLNPDALSALQKKLVYRHLAYTNALRLSLRQQEGWGELARYISEDEMRELLKAPNKPAWLLQRQGAALSESLGPEVSQQLILTHMDTTLNQLYDIQGGCERIKNTAFPDLVKLMSRVFVWVIAMLVPAALLEPNEAIYPVEFVAVLIISLSFLIVHQLALSLMHPFDNKMNDTPMSALCITIERDLRSQLGETELPPMPLPRDGVLM
ncbi:MAG: bestrophin family ion channel [Halioglobus sp.]